MSTAITTTIPVEVTGLSKAEHDVLDAIMLHIKTSLDGIRRAARLWADLSAKAKTRIVEQTRPNLRDFSSMAMATPMTCGSEGSRSTRIVLRRCRKALADASCAWTEDSWKVRLAFSSESGAMVPSACWRRRFRAFLLILAGRSGRR